MKDLLRRIYFSIGIHAAPQGTLLYHVHHFIAALYGTIEKRDFGETTMPSRYNAQTSSQAPLNLSNSCIDPRIALPSANKHLTEAEFKHCCSLIHYYREEGKQIIPYCEAHGRNPDLYDRGNVWKGAFVDHTLRMLLSKKYNNVNRLRLIGWHFSAYRVFDLSSVTEPPPNAWFHDFYDKGVAELPEDIDSLINQAIEPWRHIEMLASRLSHAIDRIPGKYLHSQPLRFGEVAGAYRGFMVNGDSVRYWGTVAALYRLRLLEHLEDRIAQRGFCRVMEIGLGYGGLAYQLKKTYGNTLQFIAVDLVESLIFSSCYLTTLLPEKTLYYSQEKTIDGKNGLVFVPTFRSPEFFEAITDIDLCLNTISMNEMTKAQVDYYGRNISKALAPDGVFFECNWMAAVAGPGRIDVKSYLALHFSHRLGVEKTEVAGDGNLDLWSNAPQPVIEEACRKEYGKDAVCEFKRAERSSRLAA